MANPIGQPQRIDLVAAIEHRVGKAGPAQEHAEDRSRRGIVSKRDQLPFDDVRSKVGLGEVHQLLERCDWIALRS